MYNKRRYVVTNIRIYSRIRKYLIIFCSALIATSLISFLFFGFYSNSGAIKFIAKYKNRNDLTIEKIMINPRVKFEHDNGDFYDIKAKKAIHQNDNDLLLFEVSVNGKAFNLEAGKMLITNDGDELTFSDNPVLIIKETPK